MEGECVTRCAAIAILTSVEWLRQTSRKVAVEPITYNNDFCKSFKIVESSCGQFTSWETLINCLKCDNKSGSSVSNGLSLCNADDKFERFSSQSDSPSSNINRVIRNTDGTVSLDTGSVVTSMLEGSWDRHDMNLT